MNCLKRILAFILLCSILFSFSACSSEAKIRSAKCLLAFEQSQYLSEDFDTVAIMHHRLKEGCCEKLNLMFFVTEHNDGLKPNQILVNDLYMLDLDTGLWYYDAVMNNEAFNLDTKENALMYFYDAFDRSRSDASSWPNSAELDFLPDEDIDYVNLLRADFEQSRVLSIHSTNEISLPLSQVYQQKVDEVLNQPAGVVKKEISTIAEAVTYLNLRFQSFSDDSMAVATGTDGLNKTIRAAVEIIESDQFSCTRGDIATCVTYLLRDNYDIETLIVFTDDLTPRTINMVRIERGYWFIDPALLMNQISDYSIPDNLPEMQCDSIDTYIERIQKDYTINSIVCLSNGQRMDYKITNGSDLLIETSSADVKQVWLNPAA